jgi:mitosis inhibitor protein kinase SWE1
VSILRSLSLDPHPNVINFIDSWEHVRRLYIRTELVECGDLARFLEALSDSGGLGEARVWKTLVELSSALAHVHSHNLLHLDVKPSNILITSAGSLKLADFGMSTITNAEGRAADLSPALPQLEDGEFVWREEGTMPSPVIDREIEGDREYLCPEALGDEPVGRPADVYR